MLRLLLAGAELRGLAAAPGQDLMVDLGGPQGSQLRRRYSIRRLNRDEGAVEITVVRHGDGPGRRWAEGASPGGEAPAVTAPRGKITVAPAAAWHLFAGDETALAAHFNMAESLSGRRPVAMVFEVADEGEEWAPPPGAEALWIHRRGRPPGEAGGLLEALGSLRLPGGPGHAYLAGEARVVLRLRDLLLGRGLERSQLSVKAYWRSDRPNEERGEPAAAE